MSETAWVAIAIIALALGSILSCLAQALRDLSRTTLEEIATIRKGAAGQARVAKILEDVEGHAAAVAFPRVFCNLVVTVALVLWIRGIRLGSVEMVGVGADPSWWVEVALGVAIASFILWVFGTVLPTAIARHAGEATVYTWSPLLRLTYLVLRPFKFIPRLVDEAVRRLAGKARHDDPSAIEDELLSVVDEAKEEGKFDETERDMIEAVVKFRNRTVAQVMTPRTEIEAMHLSDDLGKVTGTIRTIGHSRIPVYEDDIDHVVGVFYVKDLMRWLAGEGGSRAGKPFDLRSLLRPALFVPETKTIRELLPELLNKRVHIAMVADEYGGTAGLVTIEDIIEEVFGDIQDEYEQVDENEPEIRIDEPGRKVEIDARAYIEDVNAQLRPLGWELPTSEDYDTVGGFVTVTLGRIPRAGEVFSRNGHTITVLAAEPTRVTRVRVEFATSETPQEAGEETPPRRAVG